MLKWNAGVLKSSEKMNVGKKEVVLVANGDRAKNS